MRTRTDLSGMTPTEREEYRKAKQREYFRRHYQNNKLAVLRTQRDSIMRKIAELEAEEAKTAN